MLLKPLELPLEFTHILKLSRGDILTEYYNAQFTMVKTITDTGVIYALSSVSFSQLHASSYPSLQFNSSWVIIRQHRGLIIHD